MPDHALVCERHVGVGITRTDIQSHGLPLPDRDMLPVSLAETIVCYADKFYSKNGNGAGGEKSLDQVMKGLENYGPDQVERFMAWHRVFALEGRNDEF